MFDFGLKVKGSQLRRRGGLAAVLIRDFKGKKEGWTVEGIRSRVRR